MIIIQQNIINIQQNHICTYQKTKVHKMNLRVLLLVRNSVGTILKTTKYLNLGNNLTTYLLSTFKVLNARL